MTCPDCAALEPRVAALEAAQAARTPKIDPEALYTIPEVARLLGCSVSHARILVTRGDFPAIDVTPGGRRNKSLRTTGAAVLAWHAARERRPYR
jgi:hypothetical protein